MKQILLLGAAALICFGAVKDSDLDGVPDNLDKCPNTPFLETVNKYGCSTTQLKKLKKKNIKEIIFAFPPSVESEARCLFLEDKLKDLNIEFSQIAQGVPTGVHFENIDVNSLAKAIKLRFKMNS